LDDDDDERVAKRVDKEEVLELAVLGEAVRLDDTFNTP
jgi:hypothetical protein